MPDASGRRAIGQILLLATGFLVLVAISIASVLLVNKARKDSGRVTHTVEVQNQINALLLEIRRAESSARGFLLTRGPEFRREHDAAVANILPYAARLAQLIGDNPVQTTNLRELNAAIETRLDQFVREMDFVRQNNLPAATALVSEAAAGGTSVTIREVGAAMRAEEDRLLALRSVHADRSQVLASSVTIAGSSMVIALAGISIFLVRRSSRARDEAEARLRDNNLNLEATVDERTADLREANDEIQRFAYIVSHDLRSPLVNIMGFTSELEVGTQAIQKYIADEQPDPATAEAARLAASEDLPEAVRFIRASTSKMDRLINAILKLSREGRRELAPQKVDLARLVGNAVAAVQHQLDNAGARIEVGRRLPTIVSDRLALEQIVGNLIDNAVKYLSAERAGVITIDAERKHNRVLLSVADNGRGIDPKDHERIFELFRRAGAQDQPGEGIGLAHVRATVRRLGGEITVRSRLGVGSTFQLDLPMSPPSREPHSPEPTLRESTGAA